MIWIVAAMMFVVVAALWMYAGPSEPAAAENADQPEVTGSNQLGDSSSPYLLQHADNPVHWRQWSDEAFEQARQQDKPVFLSVGYSTCHWCHVMAHESFEDHEVAEVLNRHFIPIKVDREQLPDVDARYMLATQAFYALQGMPRAGGWPNSVWLMPDGRPFYAGTYFPRSQFVQLLQRIAELWQSDRQAVEQNADAMMRAMKRLREMEMAEAELDPNVVDSALEQFLTHRDSEHGGLGRSPKFPPHGVLNLALDRYRRTDDRDVLGFLTHTLNAMRRGGVYDHIGGGFHRYSTDRQWLVPHFEKMLYDNAQLIEVYAAAATITGEPDYRRVVRETFGWIERQMTHEDGGFYTALDADSEGEEGKYYVWTADEVRRVLGEDDGNLFVDVYGMREQGNWSEEATGHKSGTNIAHLPQPIGDYAASHDMDGDDLRRRLDAMRDQLLEARQQRVRPHLDDKVVVGWNGLMIEALADAGRMLDEPRYTKAAVASAEFILDSATDANGHLQRLWREGQLSGPGYLDDYAWLVNGLISLHETTGESRWLDEAQRLADVMIDRFGDPSGGGFYYTAEGHDSRVPRTKNTGGGGNTPEPNGSAARALLRLARLTDQPRYTLLARATLKAFAGAMANQPHGNESLLLAMSKLEHDPQLRQHLSTDAGPVHAELVAPDGAVQPGTTVELTVKLTIDEPYHIYSPKPGMDNLQPTVVQASDANGLTLGELRYPEPRQVHDKVFDQQLNIYDGEAAITVPVEVAAEASGEISVRLNVTWQACDDRTCLPPQTERLTATLQVRR